VNPLDELAALWYHLEPMCADVPPPPCYVCSEPTELVPPEMLYYSCRTCFPKDYDWKPIEDVRS
jgi:hypothetical protein